MKKAVSIMTWVCLIVQSVWSGQLNHPIDAKIYNRTIRVACVGDSITYGHNVNDRDKNSYPAQLQMLLGEKWQVINCGTIGATMIKDSHRPIWKECVFLEAIEFDPDVVVIMLCTNDASIPDLEKKDNY